MGRQCFLFCLAHVVRLSQGASSQCLQEWRTQLRSSLHPALFAGVYHITATLASICDVSPALRAELLIAAPKFTQAIFAALLDCYTWRLAESIYGRGTRTAWAAVGSRKRIRQKRAHPLADLTLCSLHYLSAVRGNGFAQRALCPTVLKRQSPWSPFTIGLGNCLAPPFSAAGRHGQIRMPGRTTTRLPTRLPTRTPSAQLLSMK